VILFSYKFQYNRSKLGKYKPSIKEELRENYPISLRAKATAQKLGTPLLMT
jgi:hypothetical protein